MKTIKTAFTKLLQQTQPVIVAHAHCDAPCGVYDPAQARVTAEAVLSLTKKILALKKPVPNEGLAHQEYFNTMTRYIMIKEAQAEETKKQLMILWTDYFKPEHLSVAPTLHDTFWKAAKSCSSCKQHVDQKSAEDLLATVHTIHDIFWKTKNRSVTWEPAVQ